MKVNAIDESLVVEPSVTPLVVDAIVIVGPSLSYVQLNWVAAVLLLPTESVNVLASTSIVVAVVAAVPDPDGVKMAV